MKLFLSIVSIFCLLSAFTFTGDKPTAEDEAGMQVKKKVRDFAAAIAAHDVAALQKLLHKDFRVVANRFPNPETVSVLPKELYLKMIEGKKIGGTKYQVNFDYVSVEDHSATVIAEFASAKSNMYLTLLLIHVDDEWQIVEDMALIKNE